MKLIGISGIARSGKDTVADTLVEEIKNFFPNLQPEKKSLALFLKEEMKDFFAEKFNCNIHTLDGELKERLRPLLVAYGFAKRIETKGRYFTSLLEKDLQDSPEKVYIISDIRYADNEADELFWLKNKGGKLIHVRRFQEINGSKKYLKAPNEDEKRNDPILRKNADFNIDWNTVGLGKELQTLAKRECENFIYKNFTFFQ